MTGAEAHSETANSIGIVILAAGESKRMGQPKQLLPFRGKTLLRHTVEAALGVPDAHVVVVLGAHIEDIRPGLRGMRISIAENAAWSSGMGSSLRTGLYALLAAHPETSAAIFMLCDQPAVAFETLNSLIEMHLQSPMPIVASNYGGSLGVPALFPRSFFQELLAMHDTDGAKKLIQKHRDDAVGIDFPEGVVDIDTPGDYERRHLSTE